MINVINNSNNTYFNLALEEYFLKYKDLNLQYVDSSNIKIVRRLSGGGAVYHNFGNLNFTIIESNSNIHEKYFINKKFDIIEINNIVENVNVSKYILILSNYDFIKLFE